MKLTLPILVAVPSPDSWNKIPGQDLLEYSFGQATKKKKDVI